jgi:UDP-N-acetylmuramoylalanine--D-glutamate ligase
MKSSVGKSRVTVMGLGRFGGGVGVTRWLVGQGARVTVTDLSPAEKLGASLEQIAGLDVTLRLGGHDERDFREADLVVVNPAVPERSEFLVAARDARVPVTTEINLFVERCPARTVGVTGSVGKSTITAMIGHVLSEAGQAGRTVWVGGNIGRSLLEDLDSMQPEDVVVLELSSFQLERTPAVRWSPHVAVVTNITPNHLDWHGDFDAYVAAKLNIVRFQDREREVAVIQDTATLRDAFGEIRGGLSGAWRYGLDDGVPFAVRQPSGGGDEEHLRWEGLALDVPGRHNRENAAAAMTVAHAFGMLSEDAVAALARFRALPHRLQKVAEREGVTFYDDSKCTTPEAAMTAMQAVDAPLLMILGGYDKGSDMTSLAREVARRARFAACIGATGRGIAEMIQSGGGRAEYCGSLPEAVAACRRRAESGDVVLLSPACASWDQFADYRVRGETFARLARGEEGSTS